MSASHTRQHRTAVYLGEALSHYGFLYDHPFALARYRAFEAAFDGSELSARVERLAPVSAQESDLQRFHNQAHIDRVRACSERPEGALDAGDTPCFEGMYEASLAVVGCVLDAAVRLLDGRLSRAMVPIAGLHHARPDRAAGFCVVNDIGVLIETLRREHDIQRIGYVDIDAHHGDGLFYAYVDDPELIIADSHEDGRFLYPGSGGVEETGMGPARGTKLNVPLPPRADDALFAEIWPSMERFIDAHAPDMLILQCGADAMAGDPLTHLALSTASYELAARGLCRLADRHTAGKLLALGGGGYDPENTARAWMSVLSVLAEPGPNGSSRTGDAP